MVQRRFVGGFFVLLAVLASSGRFPEARGQETIDDYSINQADFKPTDEEVEKAELLARRFTAVATNKAPAVLGTTYFQDAIKMRYPVTDGKLRLTSDYYLVAAVLVAKSMREVVNEDADKTSDELFDDWKGAQTKVLESLKTAQPTAVLEERSLSVWTQFLSKWTEDARAKARDNFRGALNEAAYELLDALTKKMTSQVESGKSTAGGSGGFTSTSSSSSGGAHFPIHERKMNHIFHKNDRRMARAESIRARR